MGVRHLNHFLGPGDEILSFSMATTFPRDKLNRDPKSGYVAINLFLGKSPDCPAPPHFFAKLVNSTGVTLEPIGRKS